MKKEYENIKTEKIEGAKIAVIATGWHRDHIDRMIEASTAILNEAGAEVEVFNVPGSYEIPLAAKLLAKEKTYEAIIAFGIILKGDTDHYEIIRDTCINEIGRIITDLEVPVIMEILPVYKIEHAIERTTGKGNKGIEAGQAAVEMVSFCRELKKRSALK